MPQGPDDPYIPDVSPVSGVPSHGTYFLGRYRIIDEIGLGGMASVHLARVDGIGGFQRWFAVKRIHAHLVEDETFVNMFLDEANVAARISHPNVATVFELGRHEDTYWIAMEYLHGEPLREVMRRTEEMGTTMPPEIACRVISEAADGLHAAHELQGKDGEKLNLIHRDVTPHNLFVTYDGATKVVDFGIAKFQDRMASTQAGTLKGKLAYMSPEQVGGETIDRRTDIFALGVVLWELTTGQRLFRMDSDLDTLAKVQECNIPPPSTMVRGYPLDLEKILMQALAKKREDRFQTAREFSRALQSLLTRRGLFIASDEVAAYMGSIFADRIVKREEHLRWASAVSDAAAAAAVPAQAPRPASRVPVLPPTPAPPPARSSAPAVGASARGAPRPAAGAPAARGQASVSATNPQQAAQPVPRPPTMAYGSPPQRAPAPQAPKGGASYPLPAAGRAAPTAASRDEDDEDRTLQATAAQQAAVHQAAAAFDDDDDGDATIVSRSAPSDSNPPSDGPTMAAPPIIPAAGAPPGMRKPSAAPYAPPPPPPPPPAPSAPRLGGGAAAARTMPLNAANPLPRPMPSQPRTQNPRPPPPAPGGNPAGAVPPGFNISDPALPAMAALVPLVPGQVNRPTMPPTRSAQPWGPPAGPPAYGPPLQQQQQPQQQLGQPYGQPQPMGPPNGQPYGQPYGQQYAPNLGPPIDYGPGQNGGYAPPQMPYGASPYQNAQNPAFAATSVPEHMRGAGARDAGRPKRIPAWAVAVASGLIALVFAGAVVIFYAFFLRTPPKPQAVKLPTSPGSAPATGQAAPPQASGQASPQAVGQASPQSSGRAAPLTGTGPFSAARAGFLALATAPVTANAPADSSSPTAAAAPAVPDTGAVAAATAPTPPTTAAPTVVPDPTPPPAQASPPPQAVAVAAPTRNYDPPPGPMPTPTPTRAATPTATNAQPTNNGGGGGGAKGYLSVICIPGCDRVELDGVPLGAAPVFKHSASVGSHRIKLVSGGNAKTISKIVIADTVNMVRESMP